MLKIAVVALLTANVAAFECGTLKVFQCTDQDCSDNCSDIELKPAECGISMIDGDPVAYGSVGTSCTYKSVRYNFWPTTQCTGETDRQKQDVFYGTCYTNSKGSFKIKTIGEFPPYYELTPQEYELRFSQRFNDNPEINVNGYGINNQFVPPLFQPTWLLNEWDRLVLCLESFPFAPFFSQGFIKALGTGDVWDTVWYNNAAAAGYQLYPEGLNKYFDLFSWSGIWAYWFSYVWSFISFSFAPFMLGIPLSIWLGILNGMKTDGIWKAFVPYWLVWFFHIKGEKNWMLG